MAALKYISLRDPLFLPQTLKLLHFVLRDHLPLETDIPSVPELLFTQTFDITG